MQSPLINADQLSQWLKLAKGTIYNLVYKRKIPFIKIGRALRFDPNEVERAVRHIPVEEISIQSMKASSGRKA
jgi:excisionase family DNA binding protein